MARLSARVARCRPPGMAGASNRLAWPHRRRGLASDGVRYADVRSSVGRRFRSVTKLTKVRKGGIWGSFLIAAAALKTPTRNGYNAQGANLTFWCKLARKRRRAPTYLIVEMVRCRGGHVG